jgi:hypothetical protein
LMGGVLKIRRHKTPTYLSSFGEVPGRFQGQYFACVF